MLADARRHPLVITAEDGIADGGVGALLAARLGGLETGTAAPPVVALGTPSAFIPHGKPAALLANLGLDGPGIAATALKALDADS
jgi:1-deoxy-D-xylulose-5-phosphate synthase